MPRGDHEITMIDSNQQMSKESSRISRVLEKIIESDDFLAFNDEVEPEFKEEYWKQISYPTCLSQIKNRLETNYYRSKEAILWETELIHINCIKFNGNNDEDSNGLFRNIFNYYSLSPITHYYESLLL